MIQIQTKNSPKTSFFQTNNSTIKPIHKSLTTIKCQMVLINSNFEQGQSEISINGRYLCLQKVYCYKEKIFLLFMINFILENKKTKNQLLKSQYDIFLQQLKTLTYFLQYRIHNLQSISNGFQKEIKQIDNLKMIQTKILLFFQQIEDRKKTLYVQNLFNNVQIQSVLQALFDSWVQRQGDNNIGSKQQFFRQMSKSISYNITVSQQKLSKAICPIKITCKKLNPSKSQRHLIYKLIQIRQQTQVICEIIQTNYQKQVYFKLRLTQNERKQKKNKRISQLFQKNNRGQFFQSQGQDSDSSDRNSELVVDQEFYRISSKISSRKDSFNSGQRPIQLPSQSFKPNNIMFKSTIEQDDLKIPQFLSDGFTRCSSLQKTNAFQKNQVFTSIDFQNKPLINEQRNSNIQKAFQINNRGSFNLAHMQQNIKVNLFDETRANLFSQIFCQEQLQKGVYLSVISKLQSQQRQKTIQPGQSKLKKQKQSSFKKFDRR